MFRGREKDVCGDVCDIKFPIMMFNFLPCFNKRKASVTYEKIFQGSLTHKYRLAHYLKQQNSVLVKQF